MLLQLVSDMTNLGAPVAEKILRPILVYVFLVVALRVFGKRELAQLNPFDLVVLLTLSNTVQNAIIGNDNSLLGGMLGAVALLVANYVTVRFLFHSRRATILLAGQPVVLMHGGRLNHKALSSELLTEDNLLVSARRQGFDDLREVDECVLEPGGIFSFRRKKDMQDLDVLNRIEAKLDQLLQARASS